MVKIGGQIPLYALRETRALVGGAIPFQQPTECLDDIFLGLMSCYITKRPTSFIFMDLEEA